MNLAGPWWLFGPSPFVDYKAVAPPFGANHLRHEDLTEERVR
jgi:hypothetical protein